MNNPPASSQISLIFPQFAKLAEYLMAHEIDAETAGFIVGKASRDLWTGAALQAAKVLGEEKIQALTQEEDLEKRFEALRKAYLEATGIDMQVNLEKAADAIVNEIIKPETSSDDTSAT